MHSNTSSIKATRSGPFVGVTVLITNIFTMEEKLGLQWPSKISKFFDFNKNADKSINEM